MPTIAAHLHASIQTKYHLRPASLVPLVFWTALLLAGCQTPANTATTGPAAETGVSATAEVPASRTAAPLPTATPIPSAIPTEAWMPSATLSPTETHVPSPTATQAAGATQVSAGDGMILVYVPAGEFVLGSRPEDVGADADEFPQRTIYLDAFWIDQTEVTNAMYAAFLNETGGHATGSSAWLNAIKEAVQIVKDGERWQPRKGLESHPAVEVTWYGAAAYCAWAGRRLPTEAEWEKAARGTHGHIYPWGSEIDCTKALYGNCAVSFTFPVGSLPDGASPYGALDMAGNVWEWVADWYAVDTYANMPQANPTGPESGTARVVRGGSFDYNAKHNRPADRRNDGPENSSYDYGFRCAVSATP
ncbi:MAG: SUMF1/EgtB/PvdO family nonheme iron enzyme [Chloroflexota bacterium]